jgi:cell division protein FtsA
MGRQQQNLITAIDLGSAKTCVLVAQLTDAGLRYLGHGIAESRGTRKGVIVDLEKAVASIQRAVEEAENCAGVPVENAIVGLGGSQVRGVDSQGGILLGARAHEITHEHTVAAAARARNIALPQDREILHLLPQQYIVDDQSGIREPRGMIAGRLEVKVHIVTALRNAKQNLVTVLNRAGIYVDDIVFEPLACADAVLRADERDLGVCLVDIGAGSSDLIVYADGGVVHTGVVPLGGDHFTNDVAVGLRTPLTEAERIKKVFGCAVVVHIPSAHEIEVPSVADRPSRLMSQRMLGEVLEPRARELFELLRDHLRQAGMVDCCGAGLVLTGGCARLTALLEVAEDVVRIPARLAFPAPLPGMPAQLAEPEFACAVGLVTYGYRARVARGFQEEPGIGAKLRSLLRVKV